MGTRFTLICALILLVISHSECREIYVDPIHGVLNQSCWDGGEALPCQTIEKALDGMINQTTILIKSGNYSLQANSSAGFEFRNMSDLAIMAIGNDTTLSHQLPVIVECEGDTGLTFVYSQNITIRGIVFAGCGVLRNSTSKFSEAISFEKFYASFYFLFCEDVRISFVNVTRSTGIGMAIYSTVGTNMIEYSNFSYNPANQNSTNGGGLYIEFSYCTPDRYKDVDCSKEGNVPLHYSTYALYTIYQSVFHNNSANIKNSVNSTFILPQRDNHQAFGRGGGLSVFFKGNATNNTIIVNESCFQNNTAIYGAGVFVEYQDWSQHNTFEMHSSRLESNWCYNYDSDVSGTGGGGSRVGYIFFDKTHAHDNAILFYSCHFLNNLAYFGGGLSFYTAREPKEATPTNTLEFHDCEWKENTARVGSALDLAVWHAVTIGVTVEALLTNCNFSHNSASYITQSGSIVPTQSGSIVGVGAFYTDSIPVYLHGDFTFEQNNHSALAAVSTGIYFQENSQVHFIGNTGRTGGAIALLGYAFIQTTDGVRLQFVNNSAEVQGGAIFAQSIGEHDLISSRNCFFRYKDIKATPLQWNSSFYFENNTAKGIANSIYATSLLTCLWGGAYGSAQNDASEVFCWNDDDRNPNRWEYSPGNCSNEIATSPASFKGSSHNISVVPGQRHFLPFTMLDDRGNNVTKETVFIARALSPNISIDSTSQYISDNRIEIRGEPHCDGNLSLETQDPRVLSTEVKVTMLPCPPGMIITAESGNSAVCVCGGNYRGLVLCFGTEFRAKMRRGGWMGQYPRDPKTRYPPMAAGECPYCSQITDKQLFNLPQNVSELNNSMCWKINRTGTLCGKCRDGYGPLVSNYLSCIECPAEPKYKVFYLMTEFLPITIFFFIVLLFNISVTSAPANAFIFFAQILTSTLKIDGDGAILLQQNVTYAVLKDIYVIPYDIWNLNFFRPILDLPLFHFCLSPNVTTLQLLSLGYVTAFYPMVLIALSFSLWWLYGQGVWPVVCLCRPLHICFARFRRIWNLQRSIIHAFATFILLSYTKFTLVSFILLTPTPLFNDKKVVGQVVYYDGTIDFLGQDHIPYVVPAIIVLLTFVAIPPIVLTAPSLMRLLEKIFNRPICARLQPGPGVQQFLDAFHGCYKDGTEGAGDGSKYDLRWFAGFYFVSRIVLFAIFAFTPFWFLQYLLQQLAFTGMIILFALFRPYKEDFYNKVDLTIFAILAAINALTMYNFYLTTTEINISNVTFAFQYFLIFCPLIYMVGYIIYNLWKSHGSKVKACVQTMTVKLPCCKNCIKNDNDNDEGFLQFTADTGRLDGSNHYRQPSVSSNDQENVLLLHHESTFTNSQRSGYGATQSTNLTDMTNINSDTAHSVTDLS